MSSAALETPRTTAPGLLLAAGLVAIAAAAALVAGWAPIAVSIATVFLFAGPHNWLEARYILGRLPARAGKLWGFFAVSFAGVVGLTAAFAYIPSYLGRASAALESDTLYAGWNTAFLLWVAPPRVDAVADRPAVPTAAWVWPAALCSSPGCGCSRSP